MKSKRSEYIVITDDNINEQMHFFEDGTKGMIIHCKKSDLTKLAKSANRKMPKKLRKFRKFVHLNPEISFLVK